MDDHDFADLAREYGIDISDYEDDFSGNSGSADTRTIQYTGNYNECDDFDDEAALYSSPSPPERNQLRNGAGYHPSQEQTPRCSVMQTDSFRSMQNYGEGSNSAFCWPVQSNVHNTSLPRPYIRQGSHAQSERDIPAVSSSVAPHLSSDSGARLHTQGDRSFRGREVENRGRQPRNAHGIRLRPTSDLPDIYRGLFKFGVFNAIQSKCYDIIMSSDANMVISAPTGSGKTVLFELGIIRMLMQANTSGGLSKCIYIAPTKALCSEKYRDWTAKFQTMGIKCCELTGDTVQFGKSVWGDARDASVIVTTGEKWDSLTRNWEDHEQILSQIQLVLVDEVHILNESRGSTLEVVISRMKARGSFVRFLLVSATVPNICDVAAWIGNGTSTGSATVMEFGEEYRPCKLTRFVYGIPHKKDQNDFQFSRLLDFRLYGILKQHSVNKPILVFCSTRRGVVATAEQLLKEYDEATEKKQTLPWSRPRRNENNFHDKILDKLAAAGIGIHHAGMSLDDRRTTEELYLNKLLCVLVATSTLAVGVNLPAHTVVIKGVKIFQNNTLQEYSDLDIVQMLGRAGRPQFDKEGVAIILCESELEQKYKALVQGKTVLESSLHRNLAEHINAEIGLGTITSLRSAKQWLHNSFLFQRIKQNPRHYAIDEEGSRSWQEKIDKMVTESIKKLQENQLVTSSDQEGDSLSSTEYGDIMSKYYIKQSTMAAILNLPERATMRELLEMLAAADEFSDVKFRNGERQIYNKLRNHDDIRFKPKKIEKSADKVSLIIQAVLGGISLNGPEYKNGDNQPSLEALTIFRHVSRIARVIVEVAIARKCGAQVKHGMELMRCLTVKAWEDRPIVLRQIENIGEKSIKVLAQHGITSLAALAKEDPMRIEILLNRRPPFGHQVLACVRQLPKYWVKITEIAVTASEGEKPVELELNIECGLHENQSDPKPKKSKTKFSDTTLVLTCTSDLDFIDFRRIATKALKSPKTFSITAHLAKPSQSILVQMASETIAGVTVNKTYKPNIPSGHYPVMDTRPLTTMEMDMTGLAEDPDFWQQMEYVPSDEEPETPMIDLTRRLPKQDQVQINGESLGTDRTTNRIQETDRSKFPKRLPNGKYVCAHTCKDKTSCKHLCCREGTERPPQLSKKRVESLYPVEDPQNTAISAPKPKSKAKTQEKTDPHLRQLEDLHRNTNVKANIHLSEGQRIKINESKRSQPAHKPKLPQPVPKFDVDLTDLKDGELLTCPVNFSSQVPSDDDLPDPHEILAAYKAKKASSETDYSNPEFDDMIRNVRFSDSINPVDGQCPGRLVDTSEAAASPLVIPAKRPLEHDNSSSVVKRFRSPRDPTPLVASPKSRSVVDTSKVRKSTHWTTLETLNSPRQQLRHERLPLFLGGSSPVWDEEFELDGTLFDVRPAGSPSPDCQANSSTLKTPSGDSRQASSSKTELWNHASGESHSQTELRATPSTGNTEGPDPDDDHERRVAEFFEWLESDNVIIVDEMDTD